MIPWTVGLQTPLSMGFPRQIYWSGLPFPSPEDLPNPRIKLWDCLFSLSITYSEFNHTVTWIDTLLLFMTEKYSSVCTDHILSWGMIFPQSVNTFYIELNSFSWFFWSFFFIFLFFFFYFYFFFFLWCGASFPFLSFLFFFPFFSSPLLTPSIRVVHLCKYAFQNWQTGIVFLLNAKIKSCDVSIQCSKIA